MASSALPLPVAAVSSVADAALVLVLLCSSLRAVFVLVGIASARRGSVLAASPPPVAARPAPPLWLVYRRRRGPSPAARRGLFFDAAILSNAARRGLLYIATCRGDFCCRGSPLRLSSSGTAAADCRVFPL